MPGPPREVEGCYSVHIKPELEQLFAGQAVRMRVLIDAHESETSPLMEAVMQQLPAAYLKAYVGLSDDQGLPVDIVVRSKGEIDPKKLLADAYGAFCTVAATAGKTVTPT